MARTQRSPRHLIAAGALLAALGAFRQTDMVLLAPLFLYAAAALPPRARRQAILVTGTLTLVWLVPLLWLAGGPAAYVHLSADLAQHSGAQTWILSLHPTGVLRNVTFVTLGVAAGLFAGLVPLLRSLRGRRSPLAQVPITDRRFLVLWATPALAVYLLLHTGQLGYVLVILPVGYLAVALALADGPPQPGEATEVRHGRGPRHMLRSTPARATGLALIVNTAAFLVIPNTGDALLGPRTEDQDDTPVPRTVEGNEIDATAVEGDRHYNLRSNDDYWHDTVGLVEDLDPERAAVLALVDEGGSFRQLTYYTPDQRVFGIGHDRQDELGYLFSAHDGESDYEIERLNDEGADSTLGLPPSVDHLVVADAQLQEWFDPGDLSHARTEARDSTVLLEIDVEPGSSVVFTGSDQDDDGGDPSVRVVQPREGEA